ncbi:MAG TPA: hypothetical protein VGY54_00305 [Polyangiaceae bacterium]|jgi:hypothetical protein|nr:hypothetical protein [Polyangiaceae bacterium]
MSGDVELVDSPLRRPQLAANSSWLPKQSDSEKDAAEGACSAYGYLRGIRDHALAIEFRFRDGTTETFPYSWLGPWRYNPSVGILLKFTGDLVTLVLIRGSNLDALVGQAMSLTDRGLARHRITFIREMEDEELRAAGKGEPTIDAIEVEEFERMEEQREWMQRVAPAFVRL